MSSSMLKMNIILAVMMTCFFFGQVCSHGAMVMPYSWFDTYKFGMTSQRMCAAGADIDEGKICPKTKGCGVSFPPGLACMWYSNYTFIPGHPTLPPKYKTYPYVTPDLKYDWTYRNPWRAPGSAHIFSPCGTAGGNPDGCIGGCGNFSYAYGVNAEDIDLERHITEWKRGSSAETAWGITANHGGGYAYRLCKVPPEGVRGVTEECFQKTHLEFYGPMQWIQYGVEGKRIEFKASRVTNGTFPAGSEWTENPIPACKVSDGGFYSKGSECREEGGKTQFPPPTLGLFGFGVNLDRTVQPFTWSIVDKLKVPSNIELGTYVLSWRWDCEQTSQVWNTCASIHIVD